jgi:hypothetical protein
MVDDGHVSSDSESASVMVEFPTLTSRPLNYGVLARVGCPLRRNETRGFWDPVTRARAENLAMMYEDEFRWRDRERLAMQVEDVVEISRLDFNNSDDEGTGQYLHTCWQWQFLGGGDRITRRLAVPTAPRTPPRKVRRLY